VAFGAMDAYKKCTGQKWVDCGLAVAGMIPGGAIARAGFGAAKAGRAIKDATALIETAEAERKLAMVGYDGALLAKRYPLSFDAMQHTFRGIEAKIGQAYSTMRHTFGRYLDYEHSLHKWDLIEAPFLAEKAVFYDCKYMWRVCGDSRETYVKPNRQASFHKLPAKPSAPVTNPWGGGFFE
jgi:hypothetical protein